MDTLLVTLLIGIMTLVASMPSIVVHTEIYETPNQVIQETKKVEPTVDYLQSRLGASSEEKSRELEYEELLKAVFGRGPMEHYSAKMVAPAPTSKSNPKSEFEEDCQLMENPCGNGLTFCENVEGYDERIEELLKKSGTKIDELSLVDEMVDEMMEEYDIAQRFGPNEDETIAFCSSNKRVRVPQLAETKNKTWQYILQTPKHKQHIMVEICDNAGVPCQYDSMMPTNRKTICKQEYIYRPMQAINNQTGERGEELFKLPSCCKCIVEYKEEYDMRR